MTRREVVLCAAVRTAIGTYGGTLKDMPAVELGGAAIREALRRGGIGGDDVQALVMGQVVQAGAGMNPARQAGIKAGLPVEVPAMTVNRVCGSGAQAVVSAALEVLSGSADCVVAGGMENMDQAPYLLPQGRWGARMGDAALLERRAEEVEVVEDETHAPEHDHVGVGLEADAGEQRVVGLAGGGEDGDLLALYQAVEDVDHRRLRLDHPFGNDP